ncbi:esterase-like activity of phytase family protein [Pseudooceanicola sp. LIPI14-2-Ac024]|uniref:esterase-like activity of phytase family protein n=1 Tax=Pseudooceanicola sp. LIPI14-2-Ac024 TaxID=3344875 RepID=UPI0035D054C5
MRPSPAVALIAALLAGPVAGAEGAAQFVGRFGLPRDLPGFNGLSGIELSEDGTGIALLSDRGELFRGQVERQAGQIARLLIDRQDGVTTPLGQPMRPALRDSEGLAIGPDGQVHISFEAVARVFSYDDDLARATALPRAAAFATLGQNTGLEALAIDGQGRLVTLPERSGHPLREYPVWRLEGDAWREIGEVPRLPPYLPVGADFGPDGRFYLLERHFAGLGFRSRVRVFDIAEDGITGGETLLETRTGEHGNLEGIAAWQDGTGAIRLTMVADDNQLSIQSSELVEYVLPLATQAQTN